MRSLSTLAVSGLANCQTAWLGFPSRPLADQPVCRSPSNAAIAPGLLRFFLKKNKVNF